MADPWTDPAQRFPTADELSAHKRGHPDEWHPMTTLYLAIITYPYEGGTVLGVYSTEQLAQAALDAHDGAPGYDAETHPVTVDHPTDIPVS